MPAVMSRTSVIKSITSPRGGKPAARASGGALKLLFVNVCLRKHAIKILPVGLASVMTYVRDSGYTNIELLDVDIAEMEDAAVEEHLRRNRYDVVLYGSIVTHYKWVKWLTHTIKRLQPQAKIIVGNSVAGSCPEVFLSNAPADAVVIGEGEMSCVGVLDAWRDGRDLAEVEGIAYRAADGSIKRTQPRKACNIEELPMVDWSFFDTEAYLHRSQGTSFGVEDDASKPVVTIPVSTARGCVFRCTFCHFVFYNDPYRFRSPQSVLAEVRRNIEQYGANYINFWDDLSFASLPQTERMVDAILALGLRFDWSAAIRSDLFGKPKFPRSKRLEVAKKMRASGCRNVGFSLESGSPEILKMMDKHIEPEYFTEQIEILREAGIALNTSVVFGYPIETPETIRQTFEQCLRNRVYPSIGYLLPLPGTAMYEYAKEKGFIVDEDRYLTDITERQDFTLNMTPMSVEEVMGHIKQGAAKLNETLELGLTEDRYIRTGGVKKHTNLKAQLRKPPLDPENMKRNENDFSFNYSEAVFDVDLGLGEDAGR